VALPFVFLVGNHSSGKSSFINYVLGRNVQLSGVAPTDDCFTIIAPGPIDRDQDGNAVTGDPDLGFSSLRIFGPTLQHHTVLKIRSGIDSNFIMGTCCCFSNELRKRLRRHNKDARLLTTSPNCIFYCLVLTPFHFCSGLARYD
jgi:hypothetical protein